MPAPCAKFSTTSANPTSRRESPPRVGRRCGRGQPLRNRRPMILAGIRQLSPRRRSSSISASPGRCKNKTSRPRSSWGDSCLWPRERPPAATLGATGSAWQAIREAFLGIVTHAGEKSTIDCGTQRQRHSAKACWMSYPLSFADQVRKIRRILEELSFEIATPDDARKMLNMKGADKTSF